VELAPQAAFVRGAYGSHLLMRGRFAEAEAEIQVARQLDPQYVNARTHMVNLRIGQGKLADARAEWAGLADLAPDSLSVHGLGAVLSTLEGDLPAALQHYERACTLLPDHPGCWAHLAGMQALMGQADEARRTLAAMHHRFADRVMSPYVLAIVALRLGSRAEALDWLQQAQDLGDPSVLLAPIDPCLAPLWTDPAMARLVRALRHRRAPAGLAAVIPAGPAVALPPASADATPGRPRRQTATAALSPARARPSARRS
jgi:tetratricopeptide (TPR) repeat protein